MCSSVIKLRGMMMMDFTMLFVCLLAFMVIQALGTYVQVQQYKKAVRRLHKKAILV